MNATNPASLWSPLRFAPFRNLIGAIAVSNAGYWMQAVAAAYLMREWTAADPFMVSLVQSALFIPPVLFLLPAGALVDMVDRRRLMMTSQAWMMVGAALLAALVAADARWPWALLALIALFAVGFALNTPTQSAIWPEMVGLKELPKAIAIYSMTNNGARLMGPAAAGALIPVMGAAGVVAFNAVTYVGVLLALWTWRRPTPSVKREPKPFLTALAGGFRFAARSAPYRAILVRGGFFFIVASIVLGVLPVKVGDADDFGTVFSFFGLGAILGALGYGRASARFSRDRIVGLAIAVHALAVLGLGVVEPVAALAALTLIAGLAWFFVMSAMQIGAQMTLPDEVRGSGLALMNLVLMAGYALGSPLWGALARLTSPGDSMAICAALSLLALALTFRMRLPQDKAA